MVKRIEKKRKEKKRREKKSVRNVLRVKSQTGTKGFIQVRILVFFIQIREKKGINYKITFLVVEAVVNKDVT